MIVGILANDSNDKPRTQKENKAQNKPAKTTVVNFGVSGFHLIVTEYKAKPVAEINPIIAPRALPDILSLYIITQTPIKAMIIAIRVDRLIISPNIKYPTIAAINGIEANMKSVTAAVVIVIEKIKPVKAVAKNIPPRIPEIPIRKKFL